MSIGLESGSEYIRRTVLATPTPSNDKVVELFDMIHESGLNYRTYNLMGVPYETKENIFETIRLNKRAKIQSVGVAFLSPTKAQSSKNFVSKKGG